jgi:hypothetical protein
MSLSSCCSTAPTPPDPSLEYESLTRLKAGEKAPKDGWFLGDEDWESHLEALSEIERKTE